MLLGFELPNHPHPDSETWAQVDALRSTIVKVRPYHLTPETLAEISRRRLVVILRNNADEGIQFNVGARYQELRGALESLVTLSPLVYCVLDNEPNHISNGTGGPGDYWSRVDQVLEQLAQLYPTVRFVSPPLAVMQYEEAWYAAGRSVIQKHDAVGVHLYGQLDTSLIRHALYLAQQVGLSLVADELGDTHKSASGDQKAAAVAGYVRLAVEAGVEVATIFIAQRPTDEWLYCTLPTDRLAQIAAVVPQEEPMPPLPTTLTLDPIAPVRPGETLRVRGVIQGIDGPYGALEIFANYPQLDESTQWGQSGQAVFVSRDGSFDHAVTLGPANAAFTEQLTGELQIRSLELDPQALASGGSWGEQPVFTFPFTILPEQAAPAPAPSFPADPTDQGHINHSLMTIHFSAGDGYNRTANPLFLDIQQVVAAIKEGKTSFQWPRRP